VQIPMCVPFAGGGALITRARARARIPLLGKGLQLHVIQIVGTANARDGFADKAPRSALLD